jgi:hypothetical protein
MLRLLTRPEGATARELMDATGLSREAVRRVNNGPIRQCGTFTFQRNPSPVPRTAPIPLTCSSSASDPDREGRPAPGRTPHPTPEPRRTPVRTLALAAFAAAHLALVGAGVWQLHELTREADRQWSLLYKIERHTCDIRPQYRCKDW